MFLWLLRYGGKKGLAAEQKLVNERQSTHFEDDSAAGSQQGSPRKGDPSTPGSAAGGGIGGDTQQVLVSELWLSMLQAFGRISLEPSDHLRSHAGVILHRSGKKTDPSPASPRITPTKNTGSPSHLSPVQSVLDACIPI